MNGISLHWYLWGPVGWLYEERYLNARMKLRLTRRMLDLKYQQSELDLLFFGCNPPLPPSQGDQIIVCYSANCLCIGRFTVCGEYSLSFFGENSHQMDTFLRKK